MLIEPFSPKIAETIGKIKYEISISNKNFRLRLEYDFSHYWMKINLKFFLFLIVTYRCCLSVLNAVTSTVSVLEGELLTVVNLRNEIGFVLVLRIPQPQQQQMMAKGASRSRVEHCSHVIFIIEMVHLISS